MSRIIIFLWLCLLSISAGVFGQASRSPFSTFGIGEPYGNYLAQHQAMGGLGVSQPQFWYLNSYNPALLVYNQFTVFQAGTLGESKTIRSGDFSEKVRGGNLNYLATAFPIMPKRWTSSLALQPYTSVDYAIESEEYFIGSGGTIADTLATVETGSGGLTQFYWANGIRINKQFSVGLRAAYLFGPVENVYSNRKAKPDPGGVLYTINYKEKTVAKGFQFTTGFSFSKDSLWRKNAYRLSVGATYTLTTDLKASMTTDFSRSGGNVAQSNQLDSRKGTISLPSSLTVGASWSKGIQWSVGTEFSYQNWSEFKSINEDDEGLGKSWRTSLGGEFTPDVLASDNYLERVTYRLGASYEQYPFIITGTAVKDFGINFGFSLPAGRSSLDLAFKVGKRGDKSETILEESYFRVYFGITFNDQWFIKRRFD